MLHVFIGYDPREAEAFAVCADSVREHSRYPVAIVPLDRRTFAHLYTRPRGPKESTDFSLSRFMVPYLMDYQGLAIFMDCDMLLQADIHDVLLYGMATPGKAAYVCQHDYTPTSTVKFLAQPQTVYPRKNWSSFMLLDCTQCTALTLDYVHTAPALDLHRFAWTTDEKIGALPLEWNWLVGEYPANPMAKNLHWTLGGPWFDATYDADHAEIWRRARGHLYGVRA